MRHWAVLAALLTWCHPALLDAIVFKYAPGIGGGGRGEKRGVGGGVDTLEGDGPAQQSQRRAHPLVVLCNRFLAYFLPLPRVHTTGH
jgi:hypothetical protein